MPKKKKVSCITNHLIGGLPILVLFVSGLLRVNKLIKQVGT